MKLTVVLASVAIVALAAIPAAADSPAFCLPLSDLGGDPLNARMLDGDPIDPDLEGYRTRLQIFEQRQSVCTFRNGEAVRFLLSIRNTTAERRTLDTFPELAIVRPGSSEEIFRWSRHAEAESDREPLVFEPGETRTFPIAWPQVDDEGRTVAPGRYDVIGGLVDAGASVADLRRDHPLHGGRHGILVADGLTEGQAVRIAAEAGIHLTTTRPDAPVSAQMMQGLFELLQGDPDPVGPFDQDCCPWNDNGVGPPFDPFSKTKHKGKVKLEGTPSDPE